ncbi:unnamed protein product [Dracunculus medinensis]|uniref:J domain-containing protein n=1 Tax=Dracunculus medinensis TaxID=318479 RepID=A0A0N4UM40_DRAME|nr:unnamed protein product [Dracunculus medinensis]
MLHRSYAKLSQAFSCFSCFPKRRVILRTVSYMPKKKNFYEILGLSQDATLEEIKRAFAEKSREVHPDGKKTIQKSYDGQSPTEKFMEIKAAYDVLKRADKREWYDRQVSVKQETADI